MLTHEPKIHGTNFDEKIDGARLRGQLERVLKVMSDGQKRTTEALGVAARCPAASAHRHLSTLRTQYGYCVEKERVTDEGGTWVYWIAGGGMGEHTRTERKMKPIGDADFFGAMMQGIYAYAKSDATGMPKVELQLAMRDRCLTWALDMAERVRKAGA